MGAQRGIGQAEEQVGGVEVGPQGDGLLQGADGGVGLVVPEVAQAELIVARRALWGSIATVWSVPRVSATGLPDSRATLMASFS